MLMGFKVALMRSIKAIRHVLFTYVVSRLQSQELVRCREGSSVNKPAPLFFLKSFKCFQHRSGTYCLENNRFFFVVADMICFQLCRGV